MMSSRPPARPAKIAGQARPRAGRARHAGARRPRLAHRARLPLPRRRLHHAQLDPPNRRAGTRCWHSEPDKHSVHAAVGCRGPAAAGRHRGCGAETRGRVLPRCRAGVLCPAHVAGLRGHGTAAVVRCGTGLAECARCFQPLSGFSRAAAPPSRA